SSRRLCPRRGGESAQQRRHYDLHLNRLHPSAVITQQTSPRLHLQQQLASAAIVRVEPEQSESSRRLDLRAHPKHECGTNQVLKRLALADKRIGDQLRAHDRNREL